MHVRRLAALSSGLTVSLMLVSAGAASATPVVPGGGTRVADSEPVTVTLTLTGRPGETVEQYAKAATTPGGIQANKRLTRDQVRARFGAPPEQLDRVSSWARGAGFTVGALDASGTRLTVSGTARAAKAAFSVDLTRTDRAGVQVRAATATPRPPAKVAKDVRAVSGLTQQVARPMNVRPAAEPNPKDGQYCATFWGEWNNTEVPQKYPAGKQSNQSCGVTGPQLRNLYGLTGNDTGAGQTVVIVGAYNNPTTLADANKAFAENGVPPLPADKYQVKTYPITPGNAQCDKDSWAYEQALDVQSVHTIAPAARIVYVAAPDCTTLEEGIAAVLADSSVDASIISNSWGMIGEPNDTAYLTATNSLLARAAILGVGTYFSSGDWGDHSNVEGSPGTSVSFPASSPWTTAVGGTTSAIGSTNQPLWQTGWANAANKRTGSTWTRLNPAFAGGAGGGNSAYFDKPTWQSKVPGSRRAVPDIAALADPYTGFHVGVTIGGSYRAGPVGGTSLATPIVASLTALAQARAGGDTTVGLLAPVLYAKQGSAQVSADVQHVAAGIWTPAIDATTPVGDYLIDVDAGVQTLKTMPGYDPLTGLGTPGRDFLTAITD